MEELEQIKKDIKEIKDRNVRVEKRDQMGEENPRGNPHLHRNRPLFLLRSTL